MKCKNIPWLQVYHKERLPPPQQLATYSKHCHKTRRIPASCTQAISSHMQTVPAAVSRKKGQRKSTAWDQQITGHTRTRNPLLQLPLPKERALLRGIITGIADFSTTYTKGILGTQLPVHTASSTSTWQ